jgi:hypothetical protein
VPGLIESQKAKQRQVLKSVANFFALAKKYDAKLTFGTDLVIGSDTNLQTKELVMRSKWFTPYEIQVQATSRGGELIALAGPRNPYPDKLRRHRGRCLCRHAVGRRQSAGEHRTYRPS